MEALFLAGSDTERVVRVAVVVALASAALRVVCDRVAQRRHAAARLDRPHAYALSLFSCVSHGALALLGLAALWHEPCLRDAARCLADDAGARGAPVPALVLAHYGATLGHYVLALAAHIFVDPPRSRGDYALMLVHHVGTLDVVLASYRDGYVRVGSLVMLLHDPADVFLDAAKLCKYVRWERGATASFLALLAVWLPTRLVRYWGGVMRAIYAARGTIPRNGTYLLRLGVIGALNAWWTLLLLRIVVSVARTGAVRDVREEDGAEAATAAPRRRRKAA